MQTDTTGRVGLISHLCDFDELLKNALIDGDIYRITSS